MYYHGTVESVLASNMEIPELEPTFLPGSTTHSLEVIPAKHSALDRDQRAAADESIPPQQKFDTDLQADKEKSFFGFGEAREVHFFCSRQISI